MHTVRTIEHINRELHAAKKDFVRIETRVKSLEREQRAKLQQLNELAQVA